MSRSLPDAAGMGARWNEEKNTSANHSPVNLSAFGLDNGLGVEGGAEVFWPVADPSGLITATITRK